MTARQPIAVGLDIGTGGARALAIDLSGHVVASGRAAFPPETTRNSGPMIEQDPLAWTTAAQAALRALTSSLDPTNEIVGIAVDATSGTFLLVDEHDRPLTPGLMYNDLRAGAQTALAAEALRGVLGPYGIEIASAFALPKILHLRKQQPQIFERCRRIVHQTDWIVGMLSGRYDVTDISTALKTGADPGRLGWPDAIEQQLAIPLRLLPEIVMPGVRVGQVTAQAAEATGLPVGTPVISGCTDGTAGCLASGASRVGDLNVTLGTTLVFKAMAASPLIDANGAIYNHRHPAGGFLPGAASSTGGAWVQAEFADTDLDALGREAAGHLPTDHLVYPLTTQGERFPFSCPSATGFGLTDIVGPAERFAAGMEGVAFLERLGTERFEALGLPIGDMIYATGGAAAGETWLRIRASTNNRAYAVPAEPECAVGAAILAAGAYLSDCSEAIRRLVRLDRLVEPDARLTIAYESKFERFTKELHQRGYL